MEAIKGLEQLGQLIRQLIERNSEAILTDCVNQGPEQASLLNVEGFGVQVDVLVDIGDALTHNQESRAT
jgi:hypothetical protein